MNTNQQAMNEQKNWQLSDAEIEALAFEEMLESQIDRANRGKSQTKTYAIRVQKIDLVTIEIQADTTEEAETKALKTLENAPEFGEVLRTDFGHMTIEDISE